MSYEKITFFYDGFSNKIVIKFYYLTKIFHVEISDSIMAALRTFFAVYTKVPLRFNIIISAAFYGDRDIKMCLYIFRPALKNFFLAL